MLLVAHAVPGDADSGLGRVSWLFRGLEPLGVRTHLLALRRTKTGRVDRTAPAGSDSVTVVPVRSRERAGHLAELFGRDGGFENAVVGHPSVEDAIGQGLEIIKRFRPDVILSSSTHMRVNEAAYRLSVESGVPQVVDWHDPISLRPLVLWPSMGFYEALAERERVWVEQGRLHIATAPSYAQAMSRRYPGCPVEVVTLGWEPADVRGAGTVTPETLLYSGSALGEAYGFADRFPSKLSRRLRRRLSLGRLLYSPFVGEVEYQPLGKQALKAIARCRGRFSSLVFRGARAKLVMGPLGRLLGRFGLAGKARLLEPTSQKQAQAEQCTAHVLWLCLAGTSRTDGEPVVSSKVFNYLASGRPIFAVLPPECDTAKILRGRPGVFMPDPHDEDGLVEALREALALPPERHFERDIDAYRRDRLAEKMVGALQKALRDS